MGKITVSLPSPHCSYYNGKTQNTARGRLYPPSALVMPLVVRSKEKLCCSTMDKLARVPSIVASLVVQRMLLKVTEHLKDDRVILDVVNERLGHSRCELKPNDFHALHV